MSQDCSSRYVVTQRQDQLENTYQRKVKDTKGKCMAFFLLFFAMSYDCMQCLDSGEEIIIITIIIITATNFSTIIWGIS